MEGLEQQLGQILSDPDSMKQIQSMISSLGLGQQAGESAPAAKAAPPAAAPAQPDLSALAGMLGALGNGGALGNMGALGTTGTAPQPALAAPAGTDALGMAAKLAPMLGRLNREDDSTRLLMALRPLLGEERRRKIDEAVKILQLMRLLPMLRDMGGLAGLMPGLGP